jgi:demethylmenaquinone methyltransferase/2-methoxy-6-polyprenyl-1,4-benzoquinol methylase
MFARIAGRYDLLNRLMTFGRDAAWRRETVDALSLSGEELVLDAGAGTGELAEECSRRGAGLRVIACDLTPEMIHVGRVRPGRDQIAWVIADARRLPFAAQAFEAVVSGFLLRNVDDLAGTLGEQRRVLLPGGRLATLDTTPPRQNALRPLIRFHFRRVIPLLGRLVAGDAAAYRYLPRSTEAFATAEQIAGLLWKAGFERVSFKRRMLGTIAIHHAIKPGGTQL